MLRRHHVVPLDRTRILEIGCGTGYWLREFVQWGARPENVVGIDLLQDRIVEARRLCAAAIHIDNGQAAELPFADGTFDLVFQSTVFTSILNPVLRRQVAFEMLRVVKRDGLMAWYDFHADNPRNPDVRGVKKREIHQLFPACDIDLRRITVAPPLLRLLAPYSWLGCYLLGQCSWACTHYLGAIRPH